MHRSPRFTSGTLSLFSFARAVWAVLLPQGYGEPLWPKANYSIVNPTCSFAHHDAAAPTLAHGLPPVKFPRGRDPLLRSYIGMLMWTSRGDMDHRRAVLAMLGDDFSFYETPMFTAYKLLAQGRIHELPSKVHLSTGHWGDGDYFEAFGYVEFWRELTEKAYSGEYMAAFPTAEDEAEASELAQAYVDGMFDGGTLAGNAIMADDDQFSIFDDTFFITYSMLSYRKAAWKYGTPYDNTTGAALAAPRVLALSPAARDRGMDTALYDVGQRAEFEGKPLTNSTLATLAADMPSVCDCEDDDFSELETPGYHLPEHVAGIEYGRHQHYYKVVHGGVPHVAMLAAEGRCVVQPDGDGPFYFCKEDECPAAGHCGPVAVVPSDPPEAVPVLAVFYTAGRGGGGGVGGPCFPNALEKRRAFEVLLRLDRNGGGRGSGVSAGGSGDVYGRRAMPPAPPGLSQLPAEVLLSLQDLTLSGPGGGAAMAVYRSGSWGRPVHLCLHTAEVRRSSVGDVLAARVAGGVG